MEHKYRDEIDATLAALDGIKRAKPRPFFYGRLQAKMEGTKGESALASTGFAMPKVAWVMGACVLLLNVSAVLYSQETTIMTTEGNQDATESYYGWEESDSIY